MLKGCQRTMIVVRGRDKSVFETAYFVLRREKERQGVARSDMVAEANRIICEHQLPPRTRAWGTRLSGFLLWLGGCLLGSGATLLLLRLF